HRYHSLLLIRRTSLYSLTVISSSSYSLYATATTQISTLSLTTLFRSARHTSDNGGQAEHNREAPVDIDPKEADSFAIRHAGSDYHAKRGEVEERKHTANDC